jgi:hypothetical protein
LHEVVINYLLLQALALPDAIITSDVAGAALSIVHDVVPNHLLLQVLHVLLVGRSA